MVDNLLVGIEYIFNLVPRPSRVFQRATLKNTERPGYTRLYNIFRKFLVLKATLVS